MRAYLRRWWPFWANCLLTGAALGATIGVCILAVTAWYVAPVWVVILAASLRHLHATRGTRILTQTARSALGKPAAPELEDGGNI